MDNTTPNTAALPTTPDNGDMATATTEDSAVERIITLTGLLNSFEAATQDDIDAVAASIRDLVDGQATVDGVPTPLIRGLQTALRNVSLAPGVRGFELEVRFYTQDHRAGHGHGGLGGRSGHRIMHGHGGADQHAQRALDRARREERFVRMQREEQRYVH